MDVLKKIIKVSKESNKILLKDNAQLVEAAKPVMEHARNLLAGSGSMMILADKNGICRKRPLHRKPLLLQ